VNYALWHLLGPVTWPLWLVLVAAMAALARRWRLTRWAALLAAAGILLFGAMPTGAWLMRWLEARYPQPASPPTDVAHIVVLAGAERLAASAASGRLEFNGHGERISEPLALARQLPAAKLWIVGGVSTGSGRRDVDWTADYWRRAGVPAPRIRVIAGTHDTCDNANGIARSLPGARVLLVTSAFHMPRAMACMAAANVDAIPYAVDRQIGLREGISLDLLDNLRTSDLVLHELVGLIYYRLAGRITRF
jgi:uncharacterized SAM-binding protein YcdF (DUF218 family)